jgi:hypothetical protein
VFVGKETKGGYLGFGAVVEKAPIEVNIGKNIKVSGNIKVNLAAILARTEATMKKGIKINQEALAKGINRLNDVFGYKKGAIGTVEFREGKLVRLLEGGKVEAVPKAEIQVGLGLNKKNVGTLSEMFGYKKGAPGTFEIKGGKAVEIPGAQGTGTIQKIEQAQKNIDNMSRVSDAAIDSISKNIATQVAKTAKAFEIKSAVAGGAGISTIKAPSIIMPKLIKPETTYHFPITWSFVKPKPIKVEKLKPLEPTFQGIKIADGPKFRIDSGTQFQNYRDVGNQFQKSNDNINTKINSAEKTINKVIDAYSTKTGAFSATAINTKIAAAEKAMQKTIDATKVRESTRAKEIVKTKIVTMQKTRPFGITTPIIVPPVVTMPPLIFPIFLAVSSSAKKKKKKTRGFNVFVKRRGKFILANRVPLSFESAESLGARVLLNTAARSFELKLAGEIEAQEKQDNTFQNNINKFYRKGERIIQKTQYSIDSAGEKMEITQQGHIARRMKAAQDRMNARMKFNIPIVKRMVVF